MSEEHTETNHCSVLQRDLLQRFKIKNDLAGKLEEINVAAAEEDGIELSLGLSLNGIFGVEPKRCVNIVRASSISGFMIGSGRKEQQRLSLDGTQEVGGLSRTCSLPMEVEEWRKRKELQTLKRLEAKRKRMEKLKNVRMVREKVVGDYGRIAGDEVVGPPVVLCKKNSVQFCSQGSIGSQGSGSGAGSSGVSDLETQEIPATNKSSEDRSPASGRSSVEQTPDNKPAEAVMENPSPIAEPRPAGPKDIEAVKKILGNMPCVSTREIGPDGERIKGFLYKCRNGEDLKIICACHGNFLSPAEFVKHGGGGDVEHPLRHIVINPSPVL